MHGTLSLKRPNEWIKTTAKIVYEPLRADLKKESRNPKWTVVAEVDPEITRLYRWWIKRQWWLDLVQPMWYPHVTVIDGRRPIRNNERWKRLDGRRIEIEYSVNVEQHWKFFVLPVRSSVFDEIRQECGFHETHPYHITFGRMK